MEETYFESGAVIVSDMNLNGCKFRTYSLYIIYGSSIFLPSISTIECENVDVCENTFIFKDFRMSK